MQVHGIVRRSSSFNTGRIEHLYKNPQAHTEGSKLFSVSKLFLYNLLYYGKVFSSVILCKAHHTPDCCLLTLKPFPACLRPWAVGSLC